MQFGSPKNKYAFGLAALAVAASALSMYMLAKYVNNPFELDLLESDVIRTKLRLAYYPSVLAAALTPVLIAWAAKRMRYRALITSICALLAVVLIAWASYSTLQLWAELGGEGLP